MITRPVEEEEILTTSVTYVEKILNSIFTGVVVIDEKTHKIVDANPNALEAIGASKKHVIGKICHHFICPAEKGKCPISDLGQTVDKSERVLLTANGETIPIFKTVTPIAWRGRKYLIESFIDIAERKRAEEALRESEEKYRSLFENARDVIFTADLKGNITHINRSIEEYDFKKDEVVGKNILNFVPKKHWPRLLKDLAKISQGKLVEGETKIVTPREKIISEYRANPMRRGKKVAGFQTILRNITERKKMEEALRESEEKYRTQFEEALDAIFVANAETGIIIDCNRAASELVGREKSELVDKHQRILHPPEEIEGEFSRTYKQHLKEKEGQVLEDRVITKNGEIKDVAIKANVFELRGKKLIQGIFRDITERKKLEDELAHERDLFRALMDNVPDPIYFKDTESRFTRVSKASCPGLGVRNPEEAVGMTDFDFCPEELAKQFRADDLMVMKSGEPLVNKEEFMIDKIGKRWYSATKVPIRGKNGQVIGLFGISRDITKLKQTEEELRRYSEHLEELVEERTRKLRQAERMAAIGETAAMVGHDLRNPLQGIVGLIYLLEKQVEDMPSEVLGKDEMTERLEMIEEQVTYMDKIVSDLRDYARPVDAELVPTCVSRLINEVLPLAAIPSNVQVSVSIPEDLPRPMLDPELMKRVFSNLIMNAVQAMPDGGRLAVKAFRDSDAAFVSIQDTGIGIPEENLSRIFKPLFTTKSKGQGFGLAVCKRIVEAHRGTIDVESEVGRGSTFTIKIPLRKEVSLVA